MKSKPLILLYIFILLICLNFYGASGLCEISASKKGSTLDANLDEILGSIEKKGLPVETEYDRWMSVMSLD